MKEAHIIYNGVLIKYRCEENKNENTYSGSGSDLGLNVESFGVDSQCGLYALKKNVSIRILKSKDLLLKDCL